LILIGIDVSQADAPEGPNLGHPASAEEIAKFDINIFPDGSGLPPGSGTVTQGKVIYDKQCHACHGEGGLGASGESLAGAEMGLTGEWPDQTIGTYWPFGTTLFEFNRRSMPMDKPGSLNNNDVYAVTAYLLYLNGIIEVATTLNAETLMQVKMPNRGGFINIWENERRKE
jgi:cytochrome c